MILSTGLQHGDVLLYVHHTHQDLFTKGIRLIEGSQYTHAGIVQDAGFTKLVLEQLGTRTFEDVPFYRHDVGEGIIGLRPLFPVPPFDRADVYRAPYGYFGVGDCLVNHLMGVVSRGAWKKRVMLGKLTPKSIICSALVGKRLWGKGPNPFGIDYRLIEPDDYFNRRDGLFDLLGEIEWVK